MTDPHPAPLKRDAAFDLSLVSQRILKLAEISVLEHLDAVARSQADGITQMCREEQHHAGRLPGCRLSATNSTN